MKKVSSHTRKPENESDNDSNHISKEEMDFNKELTQVKVLSCEKILGREKNRETNNELYRLSEKELYKELNEEIYDNPDSGIYLPDINDYKSELAKLDFNNKADSDYVFNLYDKMVRDYNKQLVRLQKINEIAEHDDNIFLHPEEKIRVIDWCVEYFRRIRVIEECMSKNGVEIKECYDVPFEVSARYELRYGSECKDGKIIDKKILEPASEPEQQTTDQSTGTVEETGRTGQCGQVEEYETQIGFNEDYSKFTLDDEGIIRVITILPIHQEAYKYVIENYSGKDSFSSTEIFKELKNNIKSPMKCIRSFSDIFLRDKGDHITIFHTVFTRIKHSHTYTIADGYNKKRKK